MCNFDVPWAGDDYVHRIGRTGRAGREGRALSLVSPDDLRLLKDIEKVTGETPSSIGDVPTRRISRRAPERGAAAVAAKATSAVVVVTATAVPSAALDTVATATDRRVQSAPRPRSLPATRHGRPC